MKTSLLTLSCIVGFGLALKAQLFSDNFARTNDPGTLTPWMVQSGSWTVTGGILKAGPNDLTGYGHAYTTNSWSDYSVEAQFQFPAGAFGGGLGGRLHPATGAHYAAWIYPEGSAGGSSVLKLIKFQSWTTFGYTNTASVPMAQVSLASVGTGWHTLKITFQVAQITVYYDASQVMNVTDVEAQPYLGGAISLDLWTDAAAYTMSVDNVTVSALPPVANNDSYSIKTGKALTVAAPGVLANDTGGGGTLTAILASGPTHGTFSLSAVGGFTYTATNNYVGTDLFTYRASDGQATSAVASATITVTQNHRPVANNDAYNAAVNTTLTIPAPGVLANDTDSDGDSLTAAVASNPGHGTLNLSANGAFSYAPNTDFTGTDSFTYRANDGQTNSTAATVTLTVLPPGELFSDNFTRGTDPGPLSPWVAQSGTWTVTGGALRGGPNGINSYGVAYVPNSWTNFSVEASLQLPAEAFGLGIDACLDPATGARYAAWIYPEGSSGGANTLKLIKFQTYETYGYNGVPWAVMESANLTSVGTNAHNLKLACAGGQLEVYFDGELVISAIDIEGQPYSGGGIGVDFWTASTGYQISVDNVLVKSWAPTSGLYENFDEVAVPALPPGWTTATTGTNFLWVTRANISHTAPNAAYLAQANKVGTSELVSPFIKVPSGQPRLSFRNRYDLERSASSGDAYDGGVLEIKIGGGVFTDIVDAGGSFVSGGYNSTISTLYSNALAGRAAWSGDSGGFITTTLDLPTNALGQIIQLRWLGGTDNGGPIGAGWYIDTVAVKANTAPALPNQANRTILELTTLTVTNTASDADVPTDTLTYSLLAAPTSATISTKGVITWTPTEAQGPSTNTFTTRVVDNGYPPLSATNSFAVVVNESNRPPVLPAQPNRTVAKSTTLIVTNTATDPDLPANTLTYALLAGPTNATINTNTGVIAWTPTEAQEGTTNVMTTVVTDFNPVAVNAQQLTATNSFTVVVSSGPLVVLETATLIGEGYLPTNNAVDQGEMVTVLFTLKNAGGANTTNLVATLLPTNGVVSPSAPQVYGALAAGGGVASQPFTFQAGATCGSTIIPTLQLQDGPVNYGTVAVSWAMGLTVLTQNFDAVTVPALPSGWTSSATGAQSPWFTTNSLSDSSPNAAFSAGAMNIGINELVSPAFTPPLGAAQLSFRNRYFLEYSDPTKGFDGGVLEIRIGNNEFTDILAAGGTFASGGYNRVIRSDYGNPLANRPAWSGDSGGYVTTLVNLPSAAAGQTVQLRWRCGTDGGGVLTGAGWRIDSIVLRGPCTVNNPPTLPAQTSRTINELTTLIVTNTASDPESPPEVLAYSLAVAPTNAVISTNGIITWTPTEAQGPGNYTFTTVVADGFSPPASATNSFSVSVNEVNSAPAQTVPTNQVIDALALWTANATASDTDLPANLLTFELVSGPSGLTVGSDGLISWTPAEEQAGSTNPIALRVYDDGSPSLSATNGFVLEVRAGTNAPAPLIQDISLSNGVVTVTWNAVNGRTYLLQWQDTPAATNWTNVLPEVVATGATASTTNATAGATQRFYRVYLKP